MKLTKNTGFSEIITKLILGIVLLLIAQWLIPYVIQLKGTPRPELFVTVDCETWKYPLCVDVNKAVSRPKSIVDPNDIKSVLSAKSMYIIKVLNDGDVAAKRPVLSLVDNIYSEVIRGKHVPKEYFKADEITLEPIQVGKSAVVVINSWTSEPFVDRHSVTEKIEIRCEARPASLIIHPCRNFISWIDKHFYRVMIPALTGFILLLLHYLFLLIRRRR